MWLCNKAHSLVYAVCECVMTVMSFVVHRDPRQWGDPSHAEQHSPYLHRPRGASPDKDRAGHSQLVHTPQRTRTGRTPFRQYLHAKFLLEFLVMTTKSRKLSHLHKVKVKNKKSLSMISVYIKVVMTKFPHWLSHHFPLHPCRYRPCQPTWQLKAGPFLSRCLLGATVGLLAPKPNLGTT